jgi:glycosyltransferase involved in cell wall biosynthesis
MRVLHLISSSGMYGAEAVILNLSRMLVECGHVSMLGVFANSANPNLQLHEASMKEGIESHLIPCSGQIDRSVLGKIRDLVKETRADIVHAHGYKADIYVYFALRGEDVPITSTCHGWIDLNLTVKLYGTADRWVLRHFDKVVAVSNEVAQRLVDSGVEPQKIREIRNGIDLRPFDTAPPSLADGRNGGPLVGLVGRLSREKGVDTYLRAASLVLREIPEARFVVVGDGPEQATLENLLKELGIADYVKLLGRRDDMPGVYASLDAIVSTSRQEGLPMVLLEGMASRIPFLATPVGKVPTIIENDVTGVLFPVDDEGTLAKALITLLRDPEKRQRMGTAARDLIERDFSAGRMAADYLAVYEEAQQDRSASKGMR